MTREETLEAIKVMQHYADGGEVEYYNSYFNSWKHDKNPYWDFQNYNYRIKKATKKIKLEAFLVDGLLSWFKEGQEDGWPRVPSEDKWVEVEE